MVRVRASEMHASKSMQLRIQVGRAAAFLAVARFLVRFVPLRLWRASLGAISRNSDPINSGPGAAPPFEDCDIVTLRHALMIGRCMDRAAEILPGHSRCLPKAVALQWILRLGRLPSKLVIAFSIKDRAGDDAYHAWVERDGEMLVGQCDSAAYKPILTFVQGIGS